MSTLTSRPFSLINVEFPELYARHLCRHSQFGINVAHLAALWGTWYAVYALLQGLFHVEWLPIALAAAYLAVVALNAPLRVCIATALFLAVFVATVLWLPELPFWVYLLMIPLFYELQSWSHKVFTVETDMTEFNARYPKGPVLFVILLIYEVPLVLNFLLFDWKKRTA